MTVSWASSISIVQRSICLTRREGWSKMYKKKEKKTMTNLCNAYMKEAWRERKRDQRHRYVMTASTIFSHIFSKIFHLIHHDILLFASHIPFLFPAPDWLCFQLFSCTGTRRWEVCAHSFSLFENRFI